jgi:SNF2-related domain/Helicase conserved C-terminal domain
MITTAPAAESPADYAAFLAGKRRRAPAAGRRVGADEIHPSLWEWQAHIVRWAVHTGRAAIFADTGMGKTIMQIEWARLIAPRALIIAPLAVAQQTIREAARIGVPVTYVRDQDDVTGGGLFITNYEMVDRFDPARWDALVLDESSRLKHESSATFQRLTEWAAPIPYRLCATATPAPNDVAELCNHAEFLGIMTRPEMLATFFVNDGKEWRLKGHAAGPMYRWMASWAVALRRPSDIGGDDTGYILPPLDIRTVIVDVPIEAPGQLFATDLGGVGGRARIRKVTLAARVDEAVRLVTGDDHEPWIVWCGLNDEASRITAALAAEGLSVVNVEGSMTPDAKAAALTAFTDGAVQIMITKPSVAGFGMNWQHCARQIFVGLGDSFESYYQCIRRSYRYGQRRPVVAHVVLSEVEAAIGANVARKQTEANRMTDQLVTAMRGIWLAEEATAA